MATPRLPVAYNPNTIPFLFRSPQMAYEEILKLGWLLFFIPFPYCPRGDHQTALSTPLESTAIYAPCSFCFTTTTTTRSFALPSSCFFFPFPPLLPGFWRQGREKLEGREAQSKAGQRELLERESSSSSRVEREKSSKRRESTHKQEASPCFLSPPPPLFLSPAHKHSALSPCRPPSLLCHPTHVLAHSSSSPCIHYHQSTTPTTTTTRLQVVGLWY